jgi:guanylate kinase
MRKESFIIAITGPSACGKTYITEKIIDLGKQLRKEGVEFQPKRFFKYVTRPYRETEIIDMNKGLDIDVKSVKSIPIENNGCKLVYRTYGDEYGLKIQDLTTLLDDNISPIVVINDVRVVEELKREFEGRVLSIFIFRETIPDKSTHLKAANARGGVSDKKSITRFEKAVALYRVFIENIFIFDRVILNVEYGEAAKNGKKIENIAHIQAENIIRGVIEKKISLNKKIDKSPKLFIVSGNAASGKDDIIKAANKMGRLQTDILKKYTSRWQEFDDENEIICKYKPKDSLVSKYNVEYESELLKFQKDFSYDKFLEEYKEECKGYYDAKVETFKSYCTREEFYQARYEIYKLEEKNKIKTGIEKFWEELKEEQEKRSVSKTEGSSSAEIPESDYLWIRDHYYELDPRYLDLEKLKKQHLGDIILEKSKISDKTENPSCYIEHDGKEYILYENNSLHGKPVNYGFEIGTIANNWGEREKHIVLTASLPNMFKICKEKFGADNVVTAFTYSEISAEHHADNSMVMGKAKLKEYDDILRYANHIADFDYALIYAETSLENKTGNQKDELVDQMFRLFRTYNE